MIMTRLDWYITRHVLGAIFIVMLVIVGLDLLFSVLDQLADLTDNYQFKDALYYVAMTGPRRLYEHIPLCSLVGCLLGLGSLATSSELTVMRAAGISTLRIIGAVMKPVMVIILAALLLGEYVVPKSEQAAQAFRTIAVANERNGSALEQGLWHREGNTFLHVRAITTDGELYDLVRYRFDENWALASSSHARSGVYTGDGWALTGITETQFLGDSTAVQFHETEQWPSGMTPSLLSTLIMEPSNLSITGLNTFSAYLGDQGLSAADYKVAFWSKMLQPLSIAGLVLVAVSFIFGPMRSVTVGQRLIAGVVIGLVFKLMQDLLGPASTVYGLPPLLGVTLPIVLSFVIGGVLLRRAG